MKKCNICLKSFEEGDEVLTLQAVKDDDGNEIKDASMAYYHRECLDKEYIQ